MKRTVGSPVVIYNERAASVGLILLDSEGPKFFHGRSLHLDVDTGKERVGTGWKYDKDDYRIIAEGKRFDLVEGIRKRKADWDRQREEHAQAYQRADAEARNMWRERWIAKHPYPQWPGIEAILEEVKRA